MAYHIVRINSQKILLDGTTQITADIDVDTAADLPDQDGIADGSAFGIAGKIRGRTGQDTDGFEGDAVPYRPA